MSKYRAFITVDANIYVEFELPEGSDLEDIESIALNAADNPTLCHHCSNHLELGGLLDVHEVVELSTGKTVYERRKS